MSFDALYFEEIDGQRRKVVLEGSLAPLGHMRGEPAFELGGELRRGRQDEIGARAPTLHITGARFNDLVVRVHLRDSRIGIKGRALEVYQKIESIREGARMLRIVWGDVLRRGILLKARFPVEGEGELQGELTFEIVDDGGTRIAKSSNALPSVTDIAENVAGARTGLLAIPGISLDLSSKLDDLWGAISRPLSSLLSLAEDLEAEIDEVRSTLSQISNQAAALKARAKAAYEFLKSVEDDADAEVAAAFARARAEALDALARVARDTHLLGVGAELRLLGTTSGRTYVVKAGETMEGIARRLGVASATLWRLNPHAPFGPLPAGLVLRLP